VGGYFILFEFFCWLGGNKGMSTKAPKRPNRVLNQSESETPARWISLSSPSFESEVLSFDITKPRNVRLCDLPVTTFESTQHYAKVFLPLILQVAFDDLQDIFRSRKYKTIYCRGTLLPASSQHSKKRKTDNPIQPSNSVKTLTIRFPIKEYVCKNGLDEERRMITRFKQNPREFAKAVVAEKVGGGKKSPEELHSGDMVMLSTSETFDRGIQMLGLVHSHARVDLRATVASTLVLEYTMDIQVPSANSLSQVKGKLCATKLTSMVTSMREYNAVCAALRSDQTSNPLLKCLLDGKDMWEKTNQKWLEPLNEIPGLSHKFFKMVTSKFNQSQQQAIWRTAHQTDGFTLIQGPPGTGKTSTSLMTLNVLHLSILNRYHSSLVPSLQNDEKKNLKVASPHILVTAPSNAAVDGLVSKFMDNGFIDYTLATYRPSVIRVGGGRCLNEKLQKYDLDYQAEEILSKYKKLSKAEKQRKLESGEASRSRLTSEITHMRESLANIVHHHKYTLESMKESGVQVDLTEAELTKALDNQKAKKANCAALVSDHHRIAGMLVSKTDELSSVHRELRQFGLCQQAGARQKLKDDLLETAHIVFVTLSSSALSNLVKLGNKFKFEVLLVDEAGQATEPSGLVPLQHGIRHCVLVGDPKQLSATVKSNEAQLHYFEQSLFERLQNAKHMSYLLDIQYRSHPLISAFPSNQFYDGKVKDADSVRRLKLDISNDIKVFQPLTFFNVHAGQESKENLSFINADEAKLVYNIYRTIRGWEKKSEKPLEIGIITPYREQINYMTEGVFRFDVRNDRHLSINSVDGFQGRECDIVLFSCVRASNNEEGSNSKTESIGFLSNKRRLNVAITRAKYLLLVVGNSETLGCSRLWSHFIYHVKQNGLFVSSVNPDSNLNTLL